MGPKKDTVSYFFLIYGNMNPLKKIFKKSSINPRGVQYVWRFDIGMLLVLGVGDQYV